LGDRLWSKEVTLDQLGLTVDAFRVSYAVQSKNAPLMLFLVWRFTADPPPVNLTTLLDISSHAV
jgi:hypothetical protein